MKLHWKQIAAAVVIGFLLGGAFGLCLGQQKARAWARQTPEQKKEKMLQKFAAELKLTDQQKTEAKKILDSTVDQMESARSEMRRKYQAIRAEMRSGMQTILKDDQRARFDKMEAEWEARKKRWKSSS